jgi:hypothetical protein
VNHELEKMWKEAVVVTQIKMEMTKKILVFAWRNKDFNF